MWAHHSEKLCYMDSNISKFFFVTTLGITIPKHSTAPCMYLSLIAFAKLSWPTFL